jgi:hypothetical protein
MFSFAGWVSCRPLLFGSDLFLYANVHSSIPRLIGILSVHPLKLCGTFRPYWVKCQKETLWDNYCKLVFKSNVCMCERNTVEIREFSFLCLTLEGSESSVECCLFPAERTSTLCVTGTLNGIVSIWDTPTQISRSACKVTPSSCL